MLTKKGVMLVALLLVSWVLLGFYVYRDLAKARFERPYGELLGYQWAHMSLAEKVFFVEGYKRGSHAGHTQACMMVYPLCENKLPPVTTSGGIVLDPCQGRSRSWSKGTDYLVQQIDLFYSRYRGDWGVHLTNLIDNLSDNSGLTIGQIHDLGNHQQK